MICVHKIGHIIENSTYSVFFKKYSKATATKMFAIMSVSIRQNIKWFATSFSVARIGKHKIANIPAPSKMAPRSDYIALFCVMMTSSNGNIFRVTGHLCGEFTGHRWIPRTKASDAELWCFLWWVNNRESVDLRRYRSHYDAIVMNLCGYNFSPLP